MKKNIFLITIFAFVFAGVTNVKAATKTLTQADFDSAYAGTPSNGVSYENNKLKLSTGNNYVLGENINNPSPSGYLYIDDSSFDGSIDLNGKTFKTILYVSAGKASIKGPGTIEASYASVIAADSSVTVDNVDLTNIDSHGHANLTIKNSKISGFAGVSDTATLTLENCDVAGRVSGYTSSNTESPSIIIKGGTFKDEISARATKLTIDGGTFEGRLNVYSYSLDVASTIKNGTFKGEATFGERSNVVIENGTFEDVIIVEGTDPDEIAKLKVKNGTFKNRMLMTEADVTIEKAKFEVEGDDAITVDAKSNLVIKNGNFVGGNNALTVTDSRSWGNIKVSIEDGYFEGKNGYALNLVYHDNVKIKEATLVGSKGAIAITTSDENVFKNLAAEGSKLFEDLKIESGASGILVATGSVVFEPKDQKYDILDGNNQTWKVGKDLVLRASGELSKFIKLIIDGKEVDSANYKKESGSTIITLKADYLKTLSSGEHTVKFIYSNGTVDAKFNILSTNNNTEEVSSSSNTSSNPKTGDNIFSYMIMLIVGIIGIGTSVICINRKKSLNK